MTQTFVRKLPLRYKFEGPQIMHMVEIDIDLDAVARYLGTKAINNVRKKAKYGFITVTVRPCVNQEVPE